MIDLSDDDQRRVENMENPLGIENDIDTSSLFGGKSQQEIMAELQKMPKAQREEYISNLMSQFGTGDSMGGNFSSMSGNRLANTRDRLRAKIAAKRNRRMGKSALMNMKDKFEKTEMKEKEDDEASKERRRKKNQKRRQRRKKQKKQKQTVQQNQVESTDASVENVSVEE